MLLNVSAPELVTVRLVIAVPPPNAPVKPMVPLPALMVNVLAPLVVPPTEKFVLLVDEMLVLLLSVTLPSMASAPV